jgi:hypothetical protein
MVELSLLQQYPEFVANQVLTQDQLNLLRDYLDQQNRLTRLRLVGLGIVCGLEARLVDTDDGVEIIISEGYGVTSDGYFIHLPETRYPRLRQYTDPDVETDDGDPFPVYPLWWTTETDTTQIPIQELLSTETVEDPVFVEDPDNNSSTFSEEDLEGKVLLLYLERSTRNLRNCFTTDCNNKGANIDLKVRALLVDQLEDPVAEGGTVDRFQPADNCHTPLPTVEVPRFTAGLQIAVGIRMDQLTEPEEIQQAYRAICEHLQKELSASVESAYEAHGNFLGLYEEEATVAAFDSRLSDIASESTLTQYHYDFFRDLAQAYNEYAELICEMVYPCCPSYRFPRHLVLRNFQSVAPGYTPGYRHPFYPSPVKNVMHRDLERAKLRFRRILGLAEYFEVPDSELERIKLTPSLPLSEPLGQRPIPYYYRPDMPAELWPPVVCCEPVVLRYEENTMELPAPSTFEDYASNPLHYGIELDTFLRVEGHLRLGYASVLNRLDNIKQRHQLSFAVKALPLKLEESGGYTEPSGLVQGYADIQEKWRSIYEGIENGSLDYDEAVVGDLREQQQDLVVRFEEWCAEQRERTLPCDWSALQSDYIVLRSELFCLLNSCQPSLDRFEELLVDDGGILPAAFYRARMDRIRLLTDFLQQIVAKDLRCFPANLFSAVSKDLTGAGIELKLLVGYALQLADGGFNPYEMYPVWNDFEDCLDHFHTHCLYPRFTSLHYWYRATAEQGYGTFGAFVTRYPGPEHYAGVGNGGTFLLVYEDEENPAVIADFALSQYLDDCCSCQVDPDNVCLPPIARSDYIIYRLEDEGVEVSLEIPVLRNDYSQNKYLEIELRPNQSESDRGANLEVVESEGVIKYERSNANPGVDHFTYRLRDTSCDLEDIGHVYIMLWRGDIDNPATGGLTGVVVEAGKPSILLEGALAEVRREDGSLLASAIANAQGRFNIPLSQTGNYQLRVSHPDCYISNTSQIDYPNIESTDVGQIQLKPGTADLRLGEGLETVDIFDQDLQPDQQYQWTNDNVYVINGPVYLEKGSELSIEEGTVVKFRFTQETGALPSALIVTRDARIFAEGTKDKPIIFTSEIDNVQLQAGSGGLWGGLYILGNAPIASSSLTGSLEEWPFDDDRNRFGGSAENHSSGILRYVSIRFSGARTNPDIISNGLTLAGVGNGTRIEYVEAFAGRGDGFTFIGGTVDAKYLVSAFNEGDAFDIEGGYTGRGQFWTCLQSPNGSQSALEVDGLLQQGANTFSKPRLYNLSLIGPGINGESSGAFVVVRNRGGMELHNSVVAHFPRFALQVEDRPNNNDSYAYLDTGDLRFENNLWWRDDSGEWAPNDLLQVFDGGSDPEATALSGHLIENNNEIKDPILCRLAWNVNGQYDPRLEPDSPAIQPPLSGVPDDGFFEQVDYMGAFSYKEPLWLRCWTRLDESSYL